MSRMPERRPSIIVADQVTPSAEPPSGRVRSLPRRPTPHFEDVDAQFFHDGDELTQAGTSDGWAEWQPERSMLDRLRQGLRWAVPVTAIAIGGVLLARNLDRSTAVAAVVEVHATAEAPAPTPAPAMVPAPVKTTEPAAPAPFALGPAPSAPAAAATPLPPAPTMAANQAPDRLADCKAAHSRHRRRELLAACSEAAAQHPEVAEIAAILAQHEFERGRVQPALTWSRKAIALDPQHADAYVFLGGAEQALGRPATARTAYRRYLELAPRGRYAADLRAVLASLR
jgi:hypothetical protein